MDKTWKDKKKVKLKKLGKKYKWLKPLFFLDSCFVNVIYLTISFFGFNGKRIGGSICAILCIIINSSFCAPVLIGSTQGSNTTLFEEEIELVSDVSEEIVLDDEQIVKEYEKNQEYIVEEIDTYTIDEILGDNKDIITDESYFENENIFKNYQDYDFDSFDWRYILINKQHPIPDDYSFTLGTIKADMKCDQRILEPLIMMLQGAKKDGINLIICSPYRDFELQKILFERKISVYMNRGYTYFDAYKLASRSVTMPGASEHQIGLAIDFICDTYTTLNWGFGDTKAGKWLANNCYEYGFVLRYPEGKENITGIGYEPWHFRYVGVEAATVIMEQKITLEEFVQDYLQ